MSNTPGLWPATLGAALAEVFGTDRRAVICIAKVEEQRRQRAAMAKAKRLAKKHGVELGPDADGYWVTHPDFDDGDNDPLQGEHFCVGGAEVLAGVQAYADAIARSKP